MKYPKQAQELAQFLQEDQEEMQEAGRIFYNDSNNSLLQTKRAEQNYKISLRSERLLQILDEVGGPSIYNIGVRGAEAVSVLALHSSDEILEGVLSEFMTLYDKDREDVYYQAIPAMTDRLLIHQHKPQRFGTQWLADERKEPFLPTVEDFDHVNERRAEYGIEPLRWPKSLAIPESEQPWLKLPLSELVMRDPTPEELNSFEQ
jgi:hypothetical protein